METQTQAPSVVAASDNRVEHYVDWPSILAGAAIASAISLVLFTFGSALGLSLSSPFEGEGMSFTWFAVATGLWVLWVSVSSFFAGSYIAGRMRKPAYDASSHEIEVRDSVHGLIMWSVTVIIGAFLAFAGTSIGIGAISQTTQIVAEMDESASEQIFAGLGDELLIGSDENIGAEDRAAVERMIVRRGIDGEFSETDKNEMVEIVVAEAGITEGEARNRVDQMVSEIEDTQKEAAAIAERARVISILTAFLTAAMLSVCAAASAFAARLGGDHRDNNVVLQFALLPSVGKHN